MIIIIKKKDFKFIKEFTIKYKLLFFLYLNFKTYSE